VFVVGALWVYGALRQFPLALKLYDRALDITPNDLEVMAEKAGIYQAQGNLQEAAGFLSGINEQTTFADNLKIKITQLRLERNYTDAVRFMQSRLAQFHYGSEYDKSWVRVMLALTQRLAGDTPGAKLIAEQARNTLEQLYTDQPDNAFAAALLSQAYAVTGQKESALKAAERAIVLLPRAKDWATGPSLEENLALVQTMCGENSRAISTLTQLLQTPYEGWVYAISISPVLLRLDPVWDPLRGDPAFQKLCEEKPQ
jgi:serine/threonine-protein kinase